MSIHQKHTQCDTVLSHLEQKERITSPWALVGPQRLLSHVLKHWLTQSPTEKTQRVTMMQLVAGSFLGAYFVFFLPSKTKSDKERTVRDTLHTHS